MGMPTRITFPGVETMKKLISRKVVSLRAVAGRTGGARSVVWVLLQSGQHLVHRGARSSRQMSEQVILRRPTRWRRISSP
jgi:hypothetical protein